MGSKFFTRPVLATIFIAFVSSAQAQGCSSVLSGIYDFNSTLNVQDNFSRFASWVCSNKQTASQESLDINVFEYGTADGEGSRSAIDQMCSERTVTESNYKKIVENSRTANKNVVDAWSRCMSRRGFTFGIKQGSDPKRFSVFMSYLQVASNVPAAKIYNGTIGFDVSSDSKVRCDSNWMNAKGRQVLQQRTVTCVREDPTKPVVITVNAEPGPLDSNGSLEVAGYTPVKIISDPPKIPNIKGGWVCLANNNTFKLDMTIDTQKSSNFSGSDIITRGTCCIGVVSTIDGQVETDRSVKFTRSNSALASPQRYSGILETHSRIKGTFWHAGRSDYDFSCTR